MNTEMCSMCLKRFELEDTLCLCHPCYNYSVEANIPKWISVKDRLPDEKFVLVFQNGKPSKAKEIAWRSATSGHWFGAVTDVTHWMELPEDPK